VRRLPAHTTGRWLVNVRGWHDSLPRSLRTG
jgi:hypothetical protein